MSNKKIRTIPLYFQKLIEATLPTILEHFPTPFFLYTEDGIRNTCKNLREAFTSIADYQNFYAVKANNNPAILDIIHSEGFGFDCSSTSEVKLALEAGANKEDIFFSSNNTSQAEFAFTDGKVGIFNFDDISLINKTGGAFEAPEIACCRYNPGPLAQTDGNFIGKPEDAKYGLTAPQTMEFFWTMRNRSCKRFMLHTMICSNERDYTNLVLTTKMMLDMVSWISKILNITFEAINIGGGFGIPYNPDSDKELDIHSLAGEIGSLFADFKENHNWAPKLFTENGRYLAGHNGVLVTKVINTKDTYRQYIGVDAQTFSSIPRPFIYGAHHEITVCGKEYDDKDHIYDIVGSLCENADKFATQRPMPKIDLGDIILVHNAGAHCYAMTGNYNGRARPAEIMIFSDGSFGLIRRQQTDEDLFREMVKPSAVKRITP